MKKYYLYLIVFALMVTLGNVGAYAQLQSKTGKRDAMGLKYPGASDVQKKGWRTLSSTHQRKHASASMMKIDGNKELWGFLIVDETEDYVPGLGTFPLTNPTQFTIHYFSEVDVSSGAGVDGIMYMQHKSFTFPISFVSVDLLTGEEKELKAYEKNDPIFMDMTYNYTTETMYAVGYNSDAEATFLYTIDLKTGDFKEVFALSYDLITLAADNKGNMFGVSQDGDLCQIMLDEKYVECVGFTNEFPMYLQSMDFDKEDNTLYWAGFTEDGNGFLATIDMESGEATRIIDPLGNNAEIVALYVPTASVEPDAPEAVKDLLIEPGEKGALTVSLSWVNPEYTVAGDELTTLSKIEIYRGEELVHTIDNPVPGAKADWTDQLKQNGYVAYKLLPFNEVGEGKAVKTDQTFVGQDVPVAVTEPLLIKEDDKNEAHISWKAPTTGVNGGWLDVASLKYDVIRYPDKKEVAKDLAETSYVDQSINKFSAYYYQIIPKTVGGEGKPAETNKLFIGDASMSLPYSCDFSTEDLRNLWIIEDANGDGYTWEFGNNYKATKDWFLEYNVYNYDEPPYIQADEWFFSAPFTFEAGKSYILKFRVRLGGDLAQEKFRATLCTDARHDAMVKVIGDYTDLNDQDFQEVAASFKVDETGEYHIGFQCYSDPDQWMIQITDISLRESFAKDMEAIVIKGLTAPVQNDATSYEVTVRNEGLENVSTYRVEVVDEDLNVLGANNVNRELAPQQTLTVEVKATMPQTGQKHLNGRVVLEGDANAGNDVSPALSVEVLSGDQLSWEYVGSKAEMSFSPNCPFATDMPYSRSQTLYLPSDLKFSEGTIEKLVYYYYISPNFGVAAQDVKIRVWLANTDMDNLKDSYVPDEEFTKVFDGSVSLDQQNNVLLIDLDEPFKYTGKNLCVFVERTGEEFTKYKGNNFLYTTDEDVLGEGRTRYYISEDAPYTSSVESGNSARMPNISLLINGKILSSIQTPEKKNRISVYPNPVVDRLHISGEFTEAELFSINGASVKVIDESMSEVDMTGFAKGVYFLKVKTESTVETHKIVVK